MTYCTPKTRGPPLPRSGLVQQPMSLAISCLSGCFSIPPYVVESVSSALGFRYIVVGRWFTGTSKTKESLERRHRLLSTIVSKDKFVKIDLQVATAYAVVGARKPLLKVSDGTVGQWNGRSCSFTKVNS